MCIILGLSEGIAHMKGKPNYDQLFVIAERQAGYFKTSQAREVGYSWERLSDLSKRGQFRRVARGIYRLAHFPGSPYEDLFIAWLRVGPKAVISHESALALYELSDLIPNEVHVIIPRTGSRRRMGLRLHTNKLQDDEVTTRQGLPVTTVARTIRDVITAGLSQEIVEQAIAESLQEGQTTQEKLRRQGNRQGGRSAEIIEQALEKSI